MNAIAHAAASAIGAITGSDSAAAPKPAGKALDPLANEETFLKLLVSQLKNQNPLEPPDTAQFVSQLTSYSQLEQLIGIRQNTDAGATTGTETGTTATNPTTP
jgi:flagellar basal-body rod modification protein FlgD